MLLLTVHILLVLVGKMLKEGEGGMDAFEHHGLKDEGEAKLSFRGPRLLGRAHVDGNYDFGCFYEVDLTTTVPILLVPSRLGRSQSRRRRRRRMRMREEVRVAGINVIVDPNPAFCPQISIHQMFGQHNEVSLMHSIHASKLHRCHGQTARCGAVADIGLGDAWETPEAEDLIQGLTFIVCRERKDKDPAGMFLFF